MVMFDLADEARSHSIVCQWPQRRDGGEAESPSQSTTHVECFLEPVVIEGIGSKRMETDKLVRMDQVNGKFEHPVPLINHKEGSRRLHTLTWLL